MDEFVDFWDTAGQERFQNLHPSYYHGASACILVFDVERKVTYKNLEKWYSEMRGYCETIPCICVANKIDTNEKVISAKFKFPQKHGLAFEFCSAADGTNVVKLFNDAIRAAWEDKHSEDRGFMVTFSTFSPMRPSGLVIYRCQPRRRRTPRSERRW